MGDRYFLRAVRVSTYVPMLAVSVVAVVALALVGCSREVATQRPVAAVRHDPRAVLEAYFDALARNDAATQRWLESDLFASKRGSPTHVVSLRLLKLAPESEASPSYREFQVALKCVVSTEAGNGTQSFRGSYSLVWDEPRDSWLLLMWSGTVRFE
jgi:hypothetical protein